MITPPHKHTAEEEIFHLLSGSATLWQDGSTCTVAAGDTIVFEAGGPAHTLIAAGDGLDVLVFGQRLTPEVSILPRTRIAWIADWVQFRKRIPGPRKPPSASPKALRATGRRTSSRSRTSRATTAAWRSASATRAAPNRAV